MCIVQRELSRCQCQNFSLVKVDELCCVELLEWLYMLGFEPITPPDLRASRPTTTSQRPILWDNYTMYVMRLILGQWIKLTSEVSHRQRIGLRKINIDPALYTIPDVHQPCYFSSIVYSFQSLSPIRLSSIFASRKKKSHIVRKSVFRDSFCGRVYERGGAQRSCYSIALWVTVCVVTWSPAWPNTCAASTQENRTTLKPRAAFIRNVLMEPPHTWTRTSNRP